MMPGISRQTQDFFKVINKKEGLAAPQNICLCQAILYKRQQYKI